jgi:glycosyltransferase involved in cell wall biosynthesis
VHHFAKLDGCEVKVVAPVPYFPAVKIGWRWKFSQVARSEVINGIEVYHPRFFMIPKFGMALYGWMMFLSVLPAVKKIKSNFDFNLIDAHYVYPDGFAAVLLGKYFKKPVVVSARGSDINLYSGFPIIRWMLRYTLAEAKTVVAVSEALKEAITTLRIPTAKVFVVPNGVDTNKFYPLSKESARKSLGLPKKRIILSAGNLTENKGFDLLIRAFRRVSNGSTGQDLFLVIVGEGIMQPMLERLIASLDLKSKVRLVGPVPHDKMNLWYNGADLFCLMSQREGWPNVLLESLACGVPVVATTAGGIPEIVCSENIGLLTERAEEKIEQAIHKAFAKTWHRSELVEHAKKFSWEKSARNLRDIFAKPLMGFDVSVNRKSFRI